VEVLITLSPIESLAGENSVNPTCPHGNSLIRVTVNAKKQGLKSPINPFFITNFKDLSVNSDFIANRVMQIRKIAEILCRKNACVRLIPAKMLRRHKNDNHTFK
jgi:hypothetical protein